MCVFLLPSTGMGDGARYLAEHTDRATMDIRSWVKGVINTLAGTLRDDLRKRNSDLYGRISKVTTGDRAWELFGFVSPCDLPCELFCAQ